MIVSHTAHPVREPTPSTPTCCTDHEIAEAADVPYIVLFKALTYFGDAEAEPMPDMLAPVAWVDVMRFFVTEIPRLSRLV